MKSTFLQTTLLTGFILGLLHGLIDASARILSGTFEWFELYQSVFISITIFILISLIIGTVWKIITIKKLFKRTFQDYHYASMLSFFLLFYLAISLNRIFLAHIPLLSIQGLISNTLILIVIITIWTILIFNKIGKLHKWLTNKKRKTYLYSIITIVFIALFFCFAIDVATLSYIPFTKTTEEKPNIIFISSITMRADHLPFYGYHLNTAPHLTELASQSLIFENSYTPNNLAQSSLASIYTGKYPSTHGYKRNNQQIPETEQTLAELLKKEGYTTASFIGNGQMKGKFGFGQGFDLYNDRIDFFESDFTFDIFSFRETAELFLPFYSFLFQIDNELTAGEVNKKVFHWLDKNEASPFFLSIYYPDNHGPYRVQGPLSDTNGTNPFSHMSNEEFHKLFLDQLNSGALADDVKNSVVLFYNNEISYVDSQIGKLLTELEKHKLMENTIIIFTGVHGQEFFDHNYFGHKSTLFNEVIKVPLILYYPEKFESKRITAPVSTIDLFPTILELAGSNIPESTEGMSLVSETNLENREYVKSEFFGNSESSIKTQIAIMTDSWKLIEVQSKNAETQFSLYNLKTDPKEQNNLYNTFPDKTNQLKTYISE